MEDENLNMNFMYPLKDTNADDSDYEREQARLSKIEPVIIDGLDKAEVLAALYDYKSYKAKESNIIDLARKFITQRVEKNNLFLDYINIYREVHETKKDPWDDKRFKLNIKSDHVWDVERYNEERPDESKAQNIIQKVRKNTVQNLKERIQFILNTKMDILRTSYQILYPAKEVNKLSKQLEVLYEIMRLYDENNALKIACERLRQEYAV